MSHPLDATATTSTLDATATTSTLDATATTSTLDATATTECAGCEDEENAPHAFDCDRAPNTWRG